MSSGVSRIALAVAATLWAGTGTPLTAQIVRGVAREAVTERPVAGAIVSIFRAADLGQRDPSTVATLAQTLTNADGRYALATGRAGTYVIVVKRIGSARFVSESFDLQDGEAKTIDVALASIGYALPPVVVSGATPCRARGAQSGRIAHLWEEARAALTATGLSRSEGRVMSTVTRYRRVLSSTALAVTESSEAVDRLTGERPFAAVDPDSLAAHGYVRVGADGLVEYYAPDDAILSSPAFLRTHCFALAEARTADSLGLAFEPIRGRDVSDVTGVLWFRPGTYELLQLEFRYTRLPFPVQDPRIGGQVSFAALPNGARYVARWYLRAPLVESKLLPIPGRVGVAPVTVLSAFAETGGWAVADQSGGVRARGALEGIVLDSAGMPLPGAVVLVPGDGATAVAAEDGAFRMDSISAGRATVVVQHPAYARLGLSVAQEETVVTRDQSTPITLRAANGREILARWCGLTPARNLVAVRLILHAGSTESALTHSLHASWDVRRRLAEGVRRTNRRVVSRAVDAAGGVTLCDVEPGAEVLVEQQSRDGFVIRRSLHTVSGTGWQAIDLNRGPR